jgi:glycosyltransferase involved in cell wall biosynthesis
MDLTILTCNFNTPDLIINLLKSLKLTSSEIPKVLVMDTSSEPDKEISNHFNEVCFNKAGCIGHGLAVNEGFDMIETRYILLVDSDILFLKDFMPLYVKFKSSGLSLMGKVVEDCGGKSLHPRIEPWFCFIDLFKLKENNIKFFDPIRTKNSRIIGKKIYDIGSTMFEDVCKFDLSVGDCDVENKYFRHYGGMSWRTQTYNPNDIDTDIDFGGTHPNKQLYEAGILVRNEYTRDIEYLKNIDIRNTFS